MAMTSARGGIYDDAWRSSLAEASQHLSTVKVQIEAANMVSHERFAQRAGEQQPAPQRVAARPTEVRRPLTRMRQRSERTGIAGLSAGLFAGQFALPEGRRDWLQEDPVVARKALTAQEAPDSGTP
jgi:hypothetical protein